MGFLSKLFGPPTRDDFAKLFMAELARQGHAAKYDPADFSLRTLGDEPHVYNLHNFYDEQCKLPKAERKTHLLRSVTACLSSQRDLPEDYEDAEPDLRIKLWCRATLEKVRLRQLLESGDGNLAFPVQEVGEHLFATVVYDYPAAVRSVSTDDLNRWGVSIYEALEVAKHNLAEDQSMLASLGDSLYVSLTGDSYDASRLLLVDKIRSLKVKGDPIAMIPNRDSLLITGSDDLEGQGMMLDLAEKGADEPRTMIFTPLRLEGDGWIDWTPPPSHPLYSRWQTLEIKYLYPEYEEQKAMLEALHEKQEIAVFVASYACAQMKDGTLSTFAVWSNGVDTLLPKAQRLMFYEEGKNIVADGEWDHVVSIVGHLMEPTEHYPPRFRVLEFPTDDQLAAIGRLA